jgi:hypothetical protein
MDDEQCISLHEYYVLHSYTELNSIHLEPKSWKSGAISPLRPHPYDNVLGSTPGNTLHFTHIMNWVKMTINWPDKHAYWESFHTISITLTRRTLLVKINLLQCNKYFIITTVAGFIGRVSFSTVRIRITHPSQRDATLWYLSNKSIYQCATL